MSSSHNASSQRLERDLVVRVEAVDGLLEPEVGLGGPEDLRQLLDHAKK